MSVLVSFMTPGRLGSVSSVGVGRCRAYEALTLSTGVTTTASAEEGEIAVIVSTEDVAITGAKGATPNAAATAATAATDAAFPISPNVPTAVEMREGEKLNFKPLS